MGSKMKSLSNTLRPGTSDGLEAVNMTNKPLSSTNADLEKEPLRYHKQTVTNINSYCRFCATEKRELKPLTDKALSDCIRVCEFLKTDLVDLDCQYLPKSICSPCHCSIIVMCIFLKSVNESQSKLLLIADGIKKMELLMDDDDSLESIPETVIVSAVPAAGGKDETPLVLKSTERTEELIENKDHGKEIGGKVILSDQTNAQEETVINLDKDVEGTVICSDQTSQEETVMNLDKDVEGTVVCSDQASQEETLINLDKDVEGTVICSDETLQEETVINLDKDVEGTITCSDQTSQEETVINLDKDVEGTVICSDQTSQEETGINVDKDVERTVICSDQTSQEETVINLDKDVEGTVICSDQTSQEETGINVDKDVERTVICSDQTSQEETVINLDKDVEGTVICSDQTSQEETVINLDKDVEVTVIPEDDLDASNKGTQRSPESEKLYPVIKCRTVDAINSDVKQKTVKAVVVKGVKVVTLNQIQETVKPSISQVDQKQEVRKRKHVNIQEKHILQEKTNKYQSVRIRKATDVIKNVMTSRRKQIEKSKANDTSEEILSQNKDCSTQTINRAEKTVCTAATINHVLSKVHPRTACVKRKLPKPEQLKNIRSVNTATSQIQNVQDTAQTDYCLIPIKKAKVGGKHQTWNNYQWICSECNNRYYKLSELSEHCKKVHKFCAGFSCADCGEKFYRITQFRVHIRNHRPLLRLHCHNCNFVAPSKTAMWEHVCSYAVDVCNHCDKKFETAAALERHLARWKRGRRKPSPSPKRFLLIRTPEKKGAAKKSLLIRTPEKKGVKEINSGVALEHAYAKTNGEALREKPNTSGSAAKTDKADAATPPAVDKENIQVSETLKCMAVIEECVIESNKEENKEKRSEKDKVDNDAGCTIVISASPASLPYDCDAGTFDDSGLEITIGPDDVEMTTTHSIAGVATTGDNSLETTNGNTFPSNEKGNPKTTLAQDLPKNLQRDNQSAVKVFKPEDQKAQGSEDSLKEHSLIRRPGLKRCYLCAKKKVDHKTCWMCSKCKRSLCKDECFSEYHRLL